MECMYYEKMEGCRVRCLLCPHKCVIEDGNIGICRVRKNENGSLIPLNYRKITSYAYDPIEKKPLYHFYPGSNILSIGSFGCNLACDYCQNWEIAHEESLSMAIEDEDVILLGKSRGSIGIAYTYNEPTISFEYVYHMAKLARRNGLKNVLVTNGYINEEPLKQLLPHIDAMNIDLKSIKDDFYKKVCRGKLEPVLNTIQLAASKTHVEITNLIVEGLNSSDEEIEELAQWIKSIDKSIPIHLTKYFPAYKMKLPETTYDALIRAKEIARKHLDYVYIGNVWGIDNNTYCPNCHNLIVGRYDKGELRGLEDGKCLKCGNRINIIY
ncbi:AmmeMemoRadiSam system radical SAM enzyme [Tepidimicrobium xylanilyticum]|uniref:AmmeMemoRadiSam system radical SAM enzyme n=1 Tax=Tepidimicrobium xylanilyticum TaxID=1123352 RepID=UPI002656A670|nr:AmmeMemoRadiSam system radical SAM enzyme [Tepidimicrobium xylanilyticum]GMG95204.1 AmmeMemoRadiSam system radical SAM enzyme [Tepidimicrobium xylanilyticum]